MNEDSGATSARTAGALSQADMDEADELFVTLSFGAAHEKAAAGAALAQWAGADPARLRHIQLQQAADRVVDHHLDDLRRRYPRHIDRVSAGRGAVAVPWVRSAWMATGLACALAVAVVAVNPVLSRQDMRSGIGEQSRIVLIDGTTALLGTDTAGVFESRLRSRAFTLEKGEALFTIAGQWRPFQVTAQSATIRDIGTTFSVRRDASQVAVAVVEGEVEISVPSVARPVRVGARRAALVQASGISPVLDGAAYDAMVSWKDRRFEFNGTPLRTVADEVQRYRQARITFADHAAAAVRVTGGFSTLDPDLLLRTLPAVAPVTVQFGRDGEVIISSR
jgi:transmembrane sensor